LPHATSSPSSITQTGHGTPQGDSVSQNRSNYGYRSRATSTEQEAELYYGERKVKIGNIRDDLRRLQQ
jgi:hypothetical protein